MTQLFANNATSVLVTGISASDPALTVLTGAGALFPSPSGGDYALLTLTQAGSETSWEIVKLTARSGDVLTITRAQEGTTAATWAAGSKVELRLTAGALATFAKGTADQTAATPAPGDSVRGYSASGAAEARFTAEEIAALANAGSGYITGRYYVPYGFHITSTTMPLTANTIYYAIFYCYRKTTFTRIGSLVTTAAAGKNIYLGVYNWGYARPTTRILDSGALSAATASGIEAVINLTLEPGIYGLALLSDGTPTMRKMEQTTAMLNQNHGLDITTMPSVYMPTEGGTSLPTTSGAIGNSNVSGSPAIYLRVV